MPASGHATLLLVNPFLLTPADTAPDPAQITIDIVVVGRDGTRRLLSATHLDVGPPQAFTENLAQFGGTALSGAVATLLALPGNTAICNDYQKIKQVKGGKVATVSDWVTGANLYSPPAR